MHPGYFLPSVAGLFVVFASAGLVGQLGLAQMLFGLGLVSWIVLGSIVLGRLVLRPQLPAPLIPTIAIEVAPAVVATFAALVIDGHRVDAVVRVLARVRIDDGRRAAAAAVRLLRLSFMPSFRAFTFVLGRGHLRRHDLARGDPSGRPARRVICRVALILAVIGAIAVRTVAALQRGRLLPSPVGTPPATPDPRPLRSIASA